MMRKTRKEIFYNYFENFAPAYTHYRNRYKYYWNDISNYTNFFVTESDSVLEVGCGTGGTISKLHCQDKVGIDFSPKMIEIARQEHPDIDFFLMEAENISLDRKFDVIILSNVLGYFDNVLDVLASVRKVCKENTRIFITYYNYFWEPVLRLGEFLGLKKHSPHQNWLTTSDIRNLLYLSDFEVFRTAKRILLPVNIPVISYFFNKILGRLPLINALCLNQFVFARPVHGVEPDVDEKYSVSVVIPARNESGNIESAIKRIPSFGKHVEIIFVEGNSTDDTWEKIKEMQQKYSHVDIKIARQEGKGKADAVRKGYSMAMGDILMILDADLTVLPEDLPKFYYALASGKGEFINGSRLVYPMEKHAMRTLNTWGNMFFSKMFSWLLEQPIKDTLCGTKVMFRSDYEKLTANRSFFGDFDPFGDFDLLFGAYKLNLKIIDLPIRYQDRQYGDTNISRFKHGFILLRMCFFAMGKIKFR
ncbi:MAG: bifunctional class I SAM-dependent methyltransferase/glycosyltransferase family 2 protein [Bacteroidota bacterium]|nr:bifunctional class I SAM-dependent methyltransferase/glycosyltransferase family 2 protein [Bacteroidota bacterium]MDP4227668.1 bifunctional class I SAM-dependent methyltransferase/glycosyltransferase family 2 protein [Bacteroidota bacterium]MDP4274178.1 bifunctional class I SAM-dependent methyltransferase/glycosyltransferase family 2 protein [Bacteroidota bacterium]